jgi:hypothetical protein
MVLDDHRILKLQFKNIVLKFFISCFHFELAEASNDSCVYRVGLEDFSMIMYFFGI